jgi:hypothetical protein
MQRVFVSYSRKDIDFARNLAGDLEKAGFETWWDISKLKGGDDWVRVIPAAIEASQYFVILLSPDSVISQWVEKEYLHALNLRLKIVPVMIRPCKTPFALANINYIDFNASDPVTSLNKLLIGLDYSGKPASETALPKKPALPLPPAPARLAIAIIGALALGIILLLFFIIKPSPPANPTPTATASQPPTLTLTSTRVITPTASDTAVSTHTASPAAFTETPTASPTLTASSTPEFFPRIELCLSPDISSIWVRTGPGRSYEVLPKGLAADECLIFSGRNADGTWLMIAPRQPNPKFAEFAYGWVRQDFLAESGQISLPEVTPLPTFTLTPTFTATSTFTPTVTETLTPTDTRVPTHTPTNLPMVEPSATSG